MAVSITQPSSLSGFRTSSLLRLSLCLSISLTTMTDERFHLQNILLRAKFLYTDAHDYRSKSLTSISLDTGISTANLSKIFSGVQIPTATNLIKILASLDCYLVVYCRGVPQFMRRSILQNFSDESGNVRDSERWRLRQNEGNTVFPEDEHLFSSSGFKQPEFVNPNLYHPNTK